jgi:hypothetical protein
MILSFEIIVLLASLTVKEEQWTWLFNPFLAAILIAVWLGNTLAAIASIRSFGRPPLVIRIRIIEHTDQEN